MLVERRGCIVLGIHQQRIGSDLCASGSIECVGQQRTAKSLALIGLIYRQSTHAHGGHGGIARQLLASAGWQISQQQAGRGQGVVASYPCRISQCHKAGCHAAANVLGDLLLEAAVQWFGITVECGSIVRGIERQELERFASSCLGPPILADRGFQRM